MRYSIIAEDNHKAELKTLERFCKKYDIAPSRLFKIAPSWVFLATPEEQIAIFDILKKRHLKKIEDYNKERDRMGKAYQAFKDEVRKAFVK